MSLSPEFQSPASTQSPAVSVGGGSNSGSSGGVSGGSSGTSGNSSTNPDDILPPKEPSVAEQLAANLAAIGALMPTDSLQPVAPQSSGNVLAGRFAQSSSMLAQNWKMITIVAVVLIAAFYLWKRYSKG